jgi:hypothetical protein
MYLPISGNATVFPPNVATINNVPLNFNGNVVIDALSTMQVGPGVLTNVGLEVNGPTFIDYITNKAIRPNVALSGSTGASTTFRGKLSSDIVSAVKDFEPAIGVKDFEGAYGLGLTYLVDIGPIRIVWGTTLAPTATPYGLNLDFLSIPPNTFDGVPGQNTTGLFVGKCLGFANINNKLGYSAFGNHFVLAVLNGTTDNVPGNIKIRNPGAVPIIDPNPNLQFDFLAIGIGKTA